MGGLQVGSDQVVFSDNVSAVCKLCVLIGESHRHSAALLCPHSHSCEKALDRQCRGMHTMLIAAYQLCTMGGW